jgi:hypothetical protein
VDRNVRALCRRIGVVPKNWGVPQVDVAGSNTFMKLVPQSHVLPPNRYTRPSVPMDAAALEVAAGREGSEFHGGAVELNPCDRSSEKKSLEREVSERMPPRK